MSAHHRLPPARKTKSSYARERKGLTGFLYECRGLLADEIEALEVLLHVVVEVEEHGVLLADLGVDLATEATKSPHSALKVVETSVL